MANVFDAIRRHQDEQAQSATPEPLASFPPPVQVAVNQGQSSAAPALLPTAVASANGNGNGNGDGLAEALTAYKDRGGPIAEQYRALRTHLLAQYPDEKFCLVITSAESGEGKTISSLNLALVLGERQERKTLVVDGDLRKGRIAKLLKLDNSAGFGDVIAGTKTLAQAIQPTVYPNLFALPAGHVAQGHVASLMCRPETGEILAELRRRYDHVLIDTPPVTAVADTGILGRAAGEALLVVRMNKTSRESTDRAIRLLKAANIRLVGMVLTHQRFYIPNYLYRYS